MTSVPIRRGLFRDAETQAGGEEAHVTEGASIRVRQTQAKERQGLLGAPGCSERQRKFRPRTFRERASPY